MNDRQSSLPAGSSGTVRLGGEVAVNRLGFGAMRITGDGIWGPPKDPDSIDRRGVPRARGGVTCGAGGRLDEEAAIVIGAEVGSVHLDPRRQRSR